MLQIKDADDFPEGSRVKEERKAIVEALESGKPKVIEGVRLEEFGKLQQRIRNAANKIGVGVTIVYQKDETGSIGDVFFEKKVKNGN